MALWLQVLSLLSPYAAGLIDAALASHVCNQRSCAVAERGAALLYALLVALLPLVPVFMLAVSHSRLDGGRLAWLLGSDLWLLMNGVVTLRAGRDHLIAIPAALIAGMAAVTAVVGVAEWVTGRRRGTSQTVTSRT